MLEIHTRDGRTTKVDLAKPDHAREWARRMADPRYQGTITGVTVSHLGVRYSLSRPTDFDPVAFSAEYVDPDPSRKLKGGHRVICHAGTVRAAVMVHEQQRAVRLTLQRWGKQRYNPGYDPLRVREG